MKLERAWLAGLVIAVFGTSAATQAPAAPGCADMERFLKTAKIGAQSDLSVGITVPRRATLSDGTLTHDATIQTVDERKLVFEGRRGTEFNFRDAWQFNVAGYELARLLGLNMVPPYVERNIQGKRASVSWWIADAMMERDRFRKKIAAPDTTRWNREMYLVRVFHQLIHDTDPNLTNILITKDWRIWMIDFTRAFRHAAKLPSAKGLVAIDRALLARLRDLTPELLQRHLGQWLQQAEIDAVIARRDLIVKHFEGEIARRGEAAVLFDSPRVSEPCGTGL